MLSQYNPIVLERVLSEADPAPHFPPIEDRSAWQSVADDLGQDAVAEFIDKAEEAADAPIPPLPATLYLEVKRTGQREGYQQPMALRRAMLTDLCIGESLENQGRFLDAILDVAWAICEESSWAYPAHQFELTDIHRPYIDLGAAMTALDLAELDALVGKALDPALRRRIYDELDRRVFTPYLERHDHWWLYQDAGRAANWCAVCNGGVAGAAILIEKDAARLADILARAAHSLDTYLDSFDADGGCSEGPGYWEYGFGYYTTLADLVAWRTDGAVDFLAGDRMRQIASYPLRTLLSGEICVNFSDCDANVRYSRSQLAYLARRLDIPALSGLALQQPPFERRSNLAHALRELFWTVPPGSEPGVKLARHDWFSGMMWMVARYDPDDADALVLAAKGGNNQEMHNQNDVGNFIVHINGESIIPDIGRGRYTKQYFGPERYDHLVNSSLGHSVPVPNGQLQEHGAEFASQLVDHRATDNEDTLELEMKDAYPAESGLTSLRRRVTLHREAPRGWVELVDSASFAQGPAPFENAITTFSHVDLGEGGVIIRGDRSEVRITYDEATVEARLEVFDDVDLALYPTTVNRVVFSWIDPAVSGQIRLEIVPVERT